MNKLFFMMITFSTHTIIDYVTSKINKKLWDNQFSVHFTYNFNVFVWLQIFNFLNCRVLDDSLNVFKDLSKSTYFMVILAIIFVLQILFLTLTGQAIRVVQWGLDPISWIFCIAVGSLSLLNLLMLLYHLDF